MLFICKALFVGGGLVCIAVAVAHEFTWWKRRKWRKGQGIIVGFTESRDSDGVSYYPEIQFEGPNGVTSFTSNYGSSEKPLLGRIVDIVKDESGNAGEQISMGNRLLFLLIPIPMGVLFIVAGWNIRPL